MKLVVYQSHDLYQARFYSNKVMFINRLLAVILEEHAVSYLTYKRSVRGGVTSTRACTD